MATPVPLIVVVGETASGKSAIGLELARRFNGEIIAADSWTVYRDFDIGTAKPTLIEQAEVKHHLIDIANAADGFSAALYKDLAFKAIKDIKSRKKLPIMVGGTGLYINSVLFNFSFMPKVADEERERRNTMTHEELLVEIKAKGFGLKGIDIRNKRRLIRLLETGGQRPTSANLRPDTLIIGVKREQQDLKQRVEQRVDAMLRDGLESEVRRLAEHYSWEAEPMKGIGYREWREYFDGSQSLDLTRQRIISATMQLAKRQRTWFKRNDRIQWVTNLSEAVDLATSFLNK